MSVNIVTEPEKDYNKSDIEGAGHGSDRSRHELRTSKSISGSDFERDRKSTRLNSSHLA